MEACPPAHVELRKGLPAPHFAPVLDGSVGINASQECACNACLDFLNCA